MRRAIFFVDCDYCHESYDRVEIVTTNGNREWEYTAAYLEEDALGDGWCHCLEEDTGEYRLMCNSCHASLSFDAAQHESAQDIDF
ncbi:MAG: hypothetical protein ACRDHZ_03810 [Ktedonobacteraceae bacterium]